MFTFVRICSCSLYVNVLVCWRSFFHHSLGCTFIQLFYLVPMWLCNTHRCVILALSPSRSRSLVCALVFVQCTTHMPARTHINTFFIAASIWPECANCSIALGYSKNAKHISQFFDVLWHWFYAAMMVFLLPGLDLSITCHVVCLCFFSHSLSCICVLHFVCSYQYPMILLVHDAFGVSECRYT